MKLNQQAVVIPSVPGVYVFRDKNDRVLYVGKSINLKNRISSYFRNASLLGDKTRTMINSSRRLETILVESEIEAILLEARLIKKYLPKFNARAKDDKSPLYIRITNEKYPKVLIVRKGEVNKGDCNFGPFPSSKTVKSVLRFLRKLFPYCSCKKDIGKPCLFSDLGLCMPSPRTIRLLSGKEEEEQAKIYRENISHLVSFLRGQKQKLINSLEKKMCRESAKQNYEGASKLRDQIRSLHYITQAFRSPSYYLKNPNLLADQRNLELTSLLEILRKNGLKIKGILRRIEAFDVSNLSGTKATGAMVTFINGEAKKNYYRRFKIKRTKRDDPAMMVEILKRRFGHRDWGKADLIIVDGGKPQVKASVSLFEKLKIKTIVIGLAKRNEELIILNNKRYQTLRISRKSPALHLLQRIRDEAHRFAVSYHHWLRSKID
ncbi:MAG TPA: GIY-YIG nuclease family protein [Candidatus Bathyarchaeia archaeon]|nr:GIY-YIG nuclease family protein [Candidatus Bathyarchaeia archaeon]